jgi:hypothetical protein
MLDVGENLYYITRDGSCASAVIEEIPGMVGKSVFQYNGLHWHGQLADVVAHGDT